MRATPTEPGRGFWTEAGGLLPPRPGETGRGGYYRAPAAGEVMVGAAGRMPGATYDEYVVSRGVRALQGHLNGMRLGIPPLAVDGLFGRRCGEAIQLVQDSTDKLTADGILGPRTMQHLLVPMVTGLTGVWSIPAWCVGGIIGAESQWDPGAVGVKTPWDTGICQINRRTHSGVTVDQAVGFGSAIDWTINELLTNHRRLSKIAPRGWDPWVLAVAAHNSPKASKEWAENGFPGTKPNPEEYVARVRAAWEDAR